MRFFAFLNKRKRNRFLLRSAKQMKWALSKKIDSVPVFVFGKQRSGTTMLMNGFENRTDTQVFQEWNTTIFHQCLVRDLDIVETAVRNSKAPFVVFKPISDSHKIREFMNRFSDARFIWIFRNYLDVANSTIRKFSFSDRAIRLVCAGKKGGGWLQDGVSEEAEHILRKLYQPSFSKFEMACLTWWARNRIVIEQDLASESNLLFLKYENLVSEPTRTFSVIFEFIGMPFTPKAFADVHTASVGKNPYPRVSPAVKDLCDKLSNSLDSLMEHNHKVLGIFHTENYRAF